MRRRLFNFAAGVSLLLFLSLLTLWVRSYWRADDLACIWDTFADDERCSRWTEVSSEMGGMFLRGAIVVESLKQGQHWPAPPTTRPAMEWITKDAHSRISLSPAASEHFGIGWEGQWNRLYPGSNVDGAVWGLDLLSHTGCLSC